jgi:hypothetical protein
VNSCHAQVRELIRRFAARRRLRPAEGEIVRIEKRQECTDTESGRTAEHHFPEIKFRPERGADQTLHLRNRRRRPECALRRRPEDRRAL